MPGHLEHLQRLAGNRAVAGRILDPGPKSRQVHADREPPAGAGSHHSLQRKRTTKPDDMSLRRLDQKLGTTGKMGSPERLEQVWQRLNALYDLNAGKGNALWKSLEDQQARYREEPAGLADSMQAIRAEYDRRYRRHYLTAVKPSSTPGQLKVETSGYEAEKPDAPDPMVYWTNVDPDRKVINVIRAYATQDLARLRDDRLQATGQPFEKIGLPHSEILWQQLTDTAREHSRGREQRGQALLKDVSGIVVHQASNIVTKQVVFMAFPDGTDWDTHDHTWGSETEEFKAILATPNVSMAAHMLRDHIDQVGGRLIDSITARGGSDHYIDINFTPPPASYDRTLLVGVFMAALLALYFLS